MEKQSNTSDKYSPLPIAPSLGPLLLNANMARRFKTMDRRTLWIGSLGIAIGVTSALVAHVLTALIGLITNVAFYGRIA